MVVGVGIGEYVGNLLTFRQREIGPGIAIIAIAFAAKVAFT